MRQKTKWGNFLHLRHASRLCEKDCINLALLQFVENIQGCREGYVFCACVTLYETQEKTAKCLKWRHLHTRARCILMNKYMNTRQKAKLPGLPGPVTGINGDCVGFLSGLMPIHDTVRISGWRRILLTWLGTMRQKRKCLETWHVSDSTISSWRTERNSRDK